MCEDCMFVFKGTIIVAQYFCIHPLRDLALEWETAIAQCSTVSRLLWQLLLRHHTCSTNSNHSEFHLN